MNKMETGQNQKRSGSQMSFCTVPPTTKVTENKDKLDDLAINVNKPSSEVLLEDKACSAGNKVTENKDQLDDLAINVNKPSSDVLVEQKACSAGKTVPEVRVMDDSRMQECDEKKVENEMTSPNFGGLDEEGSEYFANYITIVEVSSTSGEEEDEPMDLVVRMEGESIFEDQELGEEMHEYVGSTDMSEESDFVPYMTDTTEDSDDDDPITDYDVDRRNAVKFWDDEDDSEEKYLYENQYENDDEDHKE